MNEIFKIGDKVTGKVNNGMIKTNENCLIEITDVNSDGSLFSGKLIGHLQKRYFEKDKEYVNLRSDKFILCPIDRQNEILGIKIKKGKCLKTIDLGKFTIKYYESGVIESNLNSTHTMVKESAERAETLEKIKEVYTNQTNIKDFAKDVDISIFTEIFDTTVIKTALKNMMEFFKEFQFTPCYRFVNTLGHMASKDIKSAKTYIGNYFELSGSPYTDAVRAKMESQEFERILGSLSLNTPSEHVNRRLKVYYGAPGSGKTTKAMEESDNRVIPCSGQMLPEDFFRNFDFEDGKAGFKKSLLRHCMEDDNGYAITFDEINLLSPEVMKFLQTILDNKPEVTLPGSGETIQIKPDFRIIATMNLQTNAGMMPIADALVDRCYEIDSSVPSVDDLVAALM